MQDIKSTETKIGQNMFCSEVELGKFICSLDIIQHAFSENSETNVSPLLHTICGNSVLVFSCNPDYRDHLLLGEFDLVSSQNHSDVDFISTKVNPTFAINRAALELFESYLPFYEEDLLQNMHVDGPLIITGWGVGAYTAILSALRLHKAIDIEESNGSKKTKRPICITFGCPLVGDVGLQRAISERPQWKSSFLNVVMKTDPVACFYSSHTPFKPFGTYLFCTESGGHSAFEDPESVLAVLDAMVPSSVEVEPLELEYYRKILTSVRRKALYRGVSELGEFNPNSLKAGIAFQFKEIGVLDNISNIGKLEEKQAKMIKSKKNAFDPTKKLNDLKISLTYMEWYMKTRRAKGGYYDSYKNPQTKDEIESQQLIVKHQRVLNQYYKKFVDEKDLAPQKDGAKLRKRWLYSGNNYRRIVEPLDIAEYYKNGNKNYIDNRPNRYKLLEIWLIEDQKDLKLSCPRKKAVSLTEDSCFWAHVEEALISLRDLRDGGLGIDTEDHVKTGLERFEADLMAAIRDYSVSPDIFVKGSSLMKWWNEYKEYRGSAYASELAEYMNNKTYESYQ